MRTTQSITRVILVIDWVRAYGVDGWQFDFMGLDSPSLFSIHRWFPFPVVGSRSPSLARFLRALALGAISALLPSLGLSFCLWPDSSSSSSGRIVVIRYASLGLGSLGSGGLWMGVFVWVRFVTSVSGVRELGRTM